MAGTLPRSALFAVMIFALVALLAVGSAGAEESATSAIQGDTATGTTTLLVAVDPMPTALRTATAEPTTAVEGSMISGLGPEDLVTLLPSFGSIVGFLIGLIVGIIGTTAYSRTRGTLATVDQNLSMVRRGTRKEPDRRPRSPLTFRGFQLWWSRKFDVRADKTSDNLARLFTGDGIGNRIVAKAHREHGGSTTADGPIQKLEDIQSNEEIAFEETEMNSTELNPDKRSSTEQSADSGGYGQLAEGVQAPQGNNGRDDFAETCVDVRKKINTQSESVEKLLDAVDPSTSMAGGSVEIKLYEGLQKIEKYDRLEHQLSKNTLQEVDGELADKITTFLDQKDDEIEQKQDQIDQISSEVERLRPKAKAFETLVDELDTPWLRERGRIDHEPATDWLPRITRQGLVGPSVIQSTAKDIEVRGTKSGTDLISALRDPNPEQLASQLEKAISQLKQYDRVYGPSGGLRQPDDQQIVEQIDAMRTQIDRSSTPLTGMYALLDIYEDRLDTVNNQNDLERHSLAEGLDQIEIVVDDTTEPEQTGEQMELLASVTQLSEEVNRLRQPGEYEIRTGHQVTGVFTEAAEQLTERARQAYEQDEPAQARAFAEAAERIYQGVKEVYATRRLRQVLQ